MILYVIINKFTVPKIITKPSYTEIRRQPTPSLEGRDLIVWKIVTTSSGFMVASLVGADASPRTLTSPSSLVTTTPTNSAKLVGVDVVVKFSSTFVPETEVLEELRTLVVEPS